MAFELDIGFTSLAGKKPINEDFCAAMLPGAGQEAMGAICAIADGVSQGGMGKEAAQTTVTSLVRDYFGTPDTWDTTVALDRIISAQNTWLAGINRRRHPAIGMTTLTALVLRGQRYSLAHVGDTRAYLMRGGETTQISQDHVVNHPDFSHQLLRAMGLEDRVAVDYSQGDLEVGDVFILLSDGVHGSLSARAVQAMAAATRDEAGGPAVPPSTAQSISQSLVDAALAKGSQDNATALVVRVLGVVEATLQDENRHALERLVLPKLKLGDLVDGMQVTAVVADNGINLLYQMRAMAPTPATACAALPPEGVLAARGGLLALGPGIGKLYALKTLHPARAHDHEERAMLAHEAWLAKRMQTSRAADHLVHLHPHPPSPQGPSAFYLLYDWHAGETLQQLLGQQHKLGVQQAISAATQALIGLGRLHRQGVIHRDIKPANLHMGADGVLRILDLGVALSGREPDCTRLLHAGTPSYMNPEQWGYGVHGDGDEQSPNAQSDLYAVGVTLYQLLTGKLPYGDVLPYQSGRYFRDPTPPSRQHPEVPIWLDHIVMKAVARDQKLRFETAEEFLLALERGASRPLSALPATPLAQRDPTALWKIALAVSVLFNLLLVFWLVFLPK
ncbi:MAG: bifunctional protein-serine/threonine kinase/phosphatase [Burkholderiaceae bacterium]